MICIAVAGVPASAKSGQNQSITAISGRVTGNVQQVGFRALIQKQAIQYDLAGSTENNSDKSVQFTLQGDSDAIKQDMKTISKGTKKSSDVDVSKSSTAADPSSGQIRREDGQTQDQIRVKVQGQIQAGNNEG